MIRKKVKVIEEKIEFKGRSYRNYNFDECVKILNTFDWSGFYDKTDPNDCWESMLQAITAMADKLCPIKTFKINKARPPWMTNEILEIMKDRDYYYKKARTLNLADDWNIARNLRNRVGKMIKNLKADFIQNNLKEFANDSKRFLVLKENTINLKDADTAEPVPNTSIANYINRFFRDIGPKLANDLGHETTSRFVVEPLHTFKFDQLHESEVSKLIKQISVHKSSAIPSLSSRLLKDSFTILSKQLTHLFSMSLKKGGVPEKWKHATVIPIPKEGDHADVNNLRPISLLPLPGKLLEQVVHQQIMEYISMHNLLCKEQGGFRKGFSTISKIADFTDDLFTAINENKLTLAAFIDLRKAFDTVNHNILLQKLKTLGLHLQELKWFESYLVQRFQQTLANGIMSDKLEVYCGVPQGSILGPLLFLIYVNDLPRVIKFSTVHMYADDTVIYLSGRNTAEIEQSLQADLNNLAQWCSSNKLTINTTKTKTMTFGTPQQTKRMQNVRFTLNEQVLGFVESYKYLGVTLDKNLNFQKHVKSIIKTLSYKIYLLSKIRPFLTEKAAVLIYKSMVLPYIDYGDTFYFSCTKDLLNKLQRMQNRALKIIFRLNRRFPTKELHQTAGVLMLDKRREMHLLNLMYKRSKIDQYIDARSINTRAHRGTLMLIERPTLDKFRASVKFAGATLWNSLPTELQTINTYNSFRYQTKLRAQQNLLT